MPCMHLVGSLSCTDRFFTHGSSTRTTMLDASSAIPAGAMMAAHLANAPVADSAAQPASMDVAAAPQKPPVDVADESAADWMDHLPHGCSFPTIYDKAFALYDCWRHRRYHGSLCKCHLEKLLDDALVSAHELYVGECAGCQMQPRAAGSSSASATLAHGRYDPYVHGRAQ